MIDYAKITEEEFDRRLNALPKDVRDFVSSVEFKGYVADIASAYDENADEEILNALGQVMIYSILGFIKPNELAGEMLNLTADEELANQMAQDINDLVATLLEAPKPFSAIKVLAQKMDTDLPEPTKPKIVNYSAQTIIQNNPRTKTVINSPDIHPENIIDLKDLPR